MRVNSVETFGTALQDGDHDGVRAAAAPAELASRRGGPQGGNAARPGGRGDDGAAGTATYLVSPRFLPGFACRNIMLTSRPQKGLQDIMTCKNDSLYFQIRSQLKMNPHQSGLGCPAATDSRGNIYVEDVRECEGTM